MYVAVIGGTGEAGGAIVRALERRGAHPVLLGRTDPGGGREHRSVDLATGSGLERALGGVDAVVNAANARRGVRGVLVGGSERLVAAARAAGVSHLVSISIVGCERVPLGYYRAKADQDAIVEASAVPWSVVPSTQFHSLLATVFCATRRFGWLPGGATRLRPVATIELAERVAEVVDGEPRGRDEPVTGPQTQSLGELAGAFRRVTGSRALVAPPPLVGPLRGALVGGALTGEPSSTGSGPGFEHWLRGRESAR
ncbi:NAD(P)H-binding protein [Thermoleophilia bacterium SCSIO 60948]|nr:NAD(P)H-binding protein [Thermoleophilia bacterium SCSIO 60948]